ncbi:laminin G-like domain protein [Nitrososphaeria virus YSH_462411]|uniref:Laminin G-like domain protein n=1 Tax=Nitrososphaeria virus YSH_462411 TaxID=3071321 RepID=A0A976UAF3_9CAUD|nr:laminin G-like domain protein [Yangshan Harbor Nitrososphaeria virus]UVF62283.1 laminin G-like domain protein [Nitrososphaeria virus YSH_462411]
MFEQPFMMAWDSINRTTGFNLSQLKAYYKFNEASGNIINLASSVGSSDALSSEDLTVTGATYSVAGIIGNALSFDGVNDKVNGVTAANWKFLNNDAQDWSISFWLKYEGTIENGHAIIATVTDSSVEGILVDMRASGNIRCLILNASASVGGTFTVGLADANWHHYVITHDNANTDLELWFDGVSKGVIDTNIAGTANPTQALTMMNRNSEIYSNGDLDEVAIWNRLLTDVEIGQLYNSGAGLEL